MKVDRKYEVERLCDGSSRHADPWLTADGFLCATNGRALVRIPGVASVGDAPGMVPTEALKAARKATRLSEVVLLCNGTVDVPGEASYRRPDVSPPDTDSVWPKDRQARVQIAIDPFLLADLAKALGAHKDERPCLVLQIAVNADGSIDTSLPVLVHASPREKATDPAGLVMLISGKEAP